jgi:hypothetical protein
MDTINHLQALRQELCDESNEGAESKEREGKIHLAISRIDLLIEALDNLIN